MGHGDGPKQGETQTVKQLHYKWKRGCTNESGVVRGWCDIEGVDRVEKMEEGKIFYLRECVCVKTVVTLRILIRSPV